MSDVHLESPDSLSGDRLGQLLDESAQLLARLSERLLKLEDWAHAQAIGTTAPPDGALIEEARDAAGGMKRLAASLGLTHVNALVQRIESVFDAVRGNRISLDTNVVELMFQAYDRLAAMVSQFKETRSDHVSCEPLRQAIDALLSGALNDSAPTQLDGAGPSGKLETSTPAIDHFAEIVDDQVSAKYLAIFIDETELSLDSLSEQILCSENRADQGAIKSLLITAHRIKGAAATVGLNRPAKLAHFMEDILQELGENEATLTAALADALLKCIDALREYVAGLKTGAPQSDHFNSLALELIRAHPDISAEPQPAESSQPTQPDEKASRSSGPPTSLTAEALREIAQAAPVGTEAVAGIVVFEPEFPLTGLKGQLIYQKLLRMGDVFYCRPSAEQLDELEQLDQLVFGLSGGPSPERVVAQLGVTGVKCIDASAIQSTRLLDSAAESCGETTTGHGKSDAGPNTAAPSDESAAQSSVAASAPNKSGQPARGTGPTSKPAETLRVDIERLDQLMNLSGQLVINKARFARIGNRIRDHLLPKQTEQRLARAQAALSKILSHTAVDDAGHSLRSALESVRVHARHIATDLESVEHDVNRLLSVRSAVGDLTETVHQFERVSDAIQKSVMDTRMVPIGPLFARFKRIIRDVTRGTGKDIRLVIRGEKTELDKRMIDELGDPLIHMVRNAADHGIELPEDRIRAGKPAQGTVTLDAFHRGNTILIQVSDDGKGLDPPRILAKAVERGMITPADGERMTPRQIMQLIWEPGLTTAQKVTEISGRGMGMDIVRSTIEEINGAVELDSTLGEGAVFTIKLPLTLAILPSLLSEIDGDVFAIPVESVVEIVRVDREQVRTVHGVKTARVRGRVVSMIDLADVFSWTGARRQSNRGQGDCVTLVIVGEGQHEVGLAVDNLLGEEDIVVKSMSENYQNVQGIAGASILGDGRVSLILDTDELIAMASRETTAVAT